MGTGWWRGAAVVAGVLVAALLSNVSAVPALAAEATLASRALALDNMPRGWRQVHVTNSSVTTETTGCLAGLTASKEKGERRRTVSFIQHGGLPSLTESLARDPRAAHDYARSAAVLSKCTSLDFRVGKTKVHATLTPVSLAPLGAPDVAFALHFTYDGLPLVEDFSLFLDAPYIGFVEFGDTVDPPLGAVEAATRGAIAKARGAAVHLAPLSITSVREKVVATSDGSVGYRSFGAGPPLLLVMGYRGTMEVWDPRFVDALAQHFRVIIFDNAGVGRTARVPHVTIDAMADQTSALIAALHLGRPDVLGWSMGSMIAEALAVRHPGQVDRLVLCASYPGDGSAVVPPQSAIDALNSGSSAEELADLFPPGHKAAEEAYSIATSDYPSSAPAPAKVAKAQASAIKRWWAGADVAGARASSIKAPTLVADGEDDRLDATANSRAVAAVVRDARVLLYPHAGHAFLFQDEAAVVPVVVAFLG